MTSLGETVAALTAARRRLRIAGAASDATHLIETPTFAPNPGGLKMFSHTPANLAAGAALVVVLHGCGQTAEAYAKGAGWVALADQLRFALLCPEQTRGNNANLCFNWYQPSDTRRGEGEAASIRQMIADALAEHRLDPARVFVTGLSAGGAMAAAMLSTYPEVFAAGAVLAGLPYGAAANVQEALGAMFQGRRRTAVDWGDRVRAAAPEHRRAWPRISIWHGDADGTVKPEASDELVRQWTNVHGLDGATPVASQASRRSRQVWRDASGRVAVELNRIAGMGHGTPLDVGGEDAIGAAGPWLLDVGVASSREIADFFKLAGPTAAVDATVPLPKAAAPVGAARRLDPAEVIARALRSAGLGRR